MHKSKVPRFFGPPYICHARTSWSTAHLHRHRSVKRAQLNINPTIHPHSITSLWWSFILLVRHINEVTPRQARLIPKWMSDHPFVIFNQATALTQSGHPPVGRRNEYRKWLQHNSKCRDYYIRHSVMASSRVIH